LGVFVLGAFLQTAPGQVGRNSKVSKGPRALGLLELAPNGKAHLIPITILIDGKYFDAGAYKAAPVPMALWSETVYEAVRTGVSQGLFTVTGALQRKDANDATEWLGEGTWQSAESLKAKAVKKPEASEPRDMNQDEGPPVLRRSSGVKPQTTEAPAAPATPAQTPASPPVASPNAAPVPAPQTAPVPASTPSPAAASPQEEKAQEEQPPEDKDRPTLKRGKPKAAPVAREEPPAAASTKTVAPSAKTATPSAAAKSDSSPASSAADQIQLIPAISDSGGPDPLPYAYSLKPEEEQGLRKKMLALAADEVRAHAGQPAASTGASTARASSQRNKGAARKPVQPDFEDVKVRVFDLANINEPELVLTATARMPPGLHETESVSPGPQYMVTLVVREDVNSEFHKALANVTDAQHLDVLPRLELIDAVDVDGDGRGELLFREVSDAGSAFVVYRVIGDRLYPLFQGTPGK
jgi:hypothetical protein